MRQQSSPPLPIRHGFGSRRAFLAITPSAASRSFRHWLKRATDRAIGAGFCDLSFNPFLFMIESGR